MCECLKNTEERAMRELPIKNRAFQGKELKTTEFVNKVFLLEKDAGIKLTIPMEVSWEEKAKSGRVTLRKKEVDFIADYCPFCGEKMGN